MQHEFSPLRALVSTDLLRVRRATLTSPWLRSGRFRPRAMSARDSDMSTSRGRDPELRLGKLTLAKAEDYPSLVARVEAFCSVALPALDEVAQRRVLSNVFLEIIMCVPADTPHGKLMMSMIQSHNQRGASTWDDHSPASDISPTARRAILWGPKVLISQPLFTLLQFWATTLGAVEQGAKRAHSAILRVLSCSRGDMALSEYVERMRSHLAELHSCVDGDVRDLLGLLTLAALPSAPQTAALGALAAYEGGYDSAKYVQACLRVDADHLGEVSHSSMALAATQSAGPAGYGYVLSSTDCVMEVDDADGYCFVVQNGNYRGRKLGPRAQGSVFRTSQIKCWYCGELGHLRRNCPEYAAAQRAPPTGSTDSTAPPSVPRDASNSHFEALTVSALVDAVAAAAADPASPREPGGGVQVAADKCPSNKLVAFILDGGASGSLLSAQVLAQLQREGHVSVLANGIRHVRRSWKFGKGGSTSVCDVTALVNFWGGPSCAHAGGFSMRLRFSVVQDDDVPNLIGQSTLESVGAVIDHKNRTVQFGGKSGPVIRTRRSSAGHLTLHCYKSNSTSLSPSGDAEYDFASDVQSAYASHSTSAPIPVSFSGVKAAAPRGRLRIPIKDLTAEEIDNYARWVHVRWGHCGMAETNRRLSLGVFSTEMAAAIRRATQECSQCLDHRRAPSIIEASFPRFAAFNDCLELDVFFLGRAKVPMVGMVDVVTGYGQPWRPASGRHTGDDLYESFLLGWMRCFGPPRCLVVDPGSDNLSDAFMDLLLLWGVEVIPSPAENRALTSKVERWGADFKKLFDKLLNSLADLHPGAKFDHLTALVAMMLNDSTRIRGGLSPQQVATGQGITWPWQGGVGTSFGPRAQQVVNILHDLRREYVKETAVVKTRNMLRQGPRRERFQDWSIGMKGKYRQDVVGKKTGWIGPATVVSLDPDKQNIKWKYGGSEVWKSFADSVPLPVADDGLADPVSRGLRTVRDASVQADLPSGLPASDAAAGDAASSGHNASGVHAGDAKEPPASAAPVIHGVLSGTTSRSSDSHPPGSPDLGEPHSVSGSLGSTTAVAPRLPCRASAGAVPLPLPTQVLADNLDVPSDEWIVDRIVDHKRQGRGYQYKVQWARGQQGPSVTWEPGRNLRHATEVLDEYRREAGLVAFEVGSHAAYLAHSACVIPSVGDSVVLSDGVQGQVASVDGDMLQIETSLSGSRTVHAASVHKVPSWKEEAMALNEDCFNGCDTAPSAFFGSSPVVTVASAYVPVTMVDGDGSPLINTDILPEHMCLVSKSVLKKKEEDERNHVAGLFTPAKVNEIKKLFRFGAVEAVRVEDFTGQVLDARFVLTFKPGYDGRDGTVRLFDQRLVRPRARFVVRGFQEHVNPLEDMSSPTPLWSSVRLVALQAVNHGCSLSVSDVTSAFLQSDPITEQVAVPAPPEAGLPPGWLLRCVNNLYGRCSAPRAWYEKL